MGRPLVQATDVTVAYGAQRVFDHAQFNLHAGDKVAVVGPNGAGKSTLFKILLGEVRPDHPEGISFAGDLRIGYMPQIRHVDGALTGRDVLRVPSSEEARLAARIADLEAWMARPDAWDDPEANERMALYTELQERIAKERSQASGTTTPILGELGIQEESLVAKFDDLSGGEKTKLLLARTLANAKALDLVILDEPTNHLDIETVEWVEDFLMDLDGTVMLAAHDRWLLDNVATRVFEVGGHKVQEFEGNYTAYKAQREALARAWEAKRRRDHNELKRQLAIIDELKRRNKHDPQVASRKKRLGIGTNRSAGGAAASEGARTALGHAATSGGPVIRLEFAAGAKHGNDVLTVEHVAKAFDGRTLFRDVSFEVLKGDKIALIGPNGCGKTTLLTILAGVLKPDRGVVDKVPGVKMGYYAQEHETMDPERTVLDEMRLSRGESRLVPEAEARSMLGRFLFKGEDAHKKCGVLSGGERARLALSKFMLAECNLLLLDEPTNHLDIPSQEVIQAALEAYTGTVIVVSHDRSFLDAVCNKVALVAGGKVGVFVGRFRDAWTMARLAEFAALDAKKRYKVLRGFTDWEADRRYIGGDRFAITGLETQAFRRLLTRAIEMGWVEEEG